MASIFTTLGHLAGQASRLPMIRPLLDATADVAREGVRTTKRAIRLAVLRRKRTRHLALLGKTAYNLHRHGIDPLTNAHTAVITRVLAEFDADIAILEAEIDEERLASPPPQPPVSR